MKLKRLISLLLVVVMLATLAPVSVFADTVSDSCVVHYVYSVEVGKHNVSEGNPLTALHNAKAAADDVIKRGTTFTLPTVKGFEPCTNDGTVYSGGTATAANTAEMTVYYMIANSSYTVNYYFQNVSNNKPQEGYTLVASDSFSAKSGEKVFSTQNSTLATNTEFFKDDLAAVKPLYESGYYKIPTYDTSLRVASDGETVINLYYDLKQYIVAYDWQGGTYSSNAPSTDIYAAGAAITLPAAPTKQGYTFTGWYDAASGGSKVGNAGASYTVTKATRLYARWSEITSGTTASLTENVWVESSTAGVYNLLATKTVTGKTVGSSFTPKIGDFDTDIANSITSKMCNIAEEHTHRAFGQTNSCYAYKVCTHSHNQTCYGITESAGTLNQDIFDGENNSYNVLDKFISLGLKNMDLCCVVDAKLSTASGHHLGNCDYFWYIYYDNAFYEVNNTQAGPSYKSSLITEWDDGNRGTGGLNMKHSNVLQIYSTTLTLDCGHTIGSRCAKCGVTELVCTKTEHTHGANCLYEFKSNNAVTVKADGSTVANVYYDRKTYTLSFGLNDWENGLGTISKKWGENIYDLFMAKGFVSSTERYTQWDSASHSSESGRRMLVNMPTSNAYYDYSEHKGTNDTQYEIKYWLETANSTRPVSSTGGAGADYGTTPAYTAYTNSSTKTYTSADGVPIEGFTILGVQDASGGDLFGWSLVADQGNAPYAGFPNVYYTRNRYTLTLKNGTTNVASDATVFYDKAFSGTIAATTTANNPTAAGYPSHYVFAGWALSPHGEAITDLSTAKMPARDTTLYAVYKVPTYSVTFPAVDGKDRTYYPEYGYGLGLTWSLILNYSDGSGRTFLYWRDPDTGKIIDPTTTAITKNITAEAVFAPAVTTTPVNYTVKYKINGSETTETFSGTPGTAVTVAAKSGSTLGNEAYFPDAASKSILLSSTAANNVIEFTYATKGKVSYTVKCVDADGKELTPVSGSVTSGSSSAASVEVTAPTVTGYYATEASRNVPLYTKGGSNEVVFYYKAYVYDATPTASDKIYMGVKETITANVTSTPTGGALPDGTWSWSSDNEACVSVTNTNASSTTMTGGSTAGEATITGTYTYTVQNETKTLTCTKTVTNYIFTGSTTINGNVVSDYQISYNRYNNGSTTVVNSGSTATIKAIADQTLPTGGTWTWTSDKEAVVTVSGTTDEGTITSKSTAGKAEITATYTYKGVDICTCKQTVSNYIIRIVLGSSTTYYNRNTTTHEASNTFRLDVTDPDGTTYTGTKFKPNAYTTTTLSGSTYDFGDSANRSMTISAVDATSYDPALVINSSNAVKFTGKGGASKLQFTANWVDNAGIPRSITTKTQNIYNVKVTCGVKINGTRVTEYTLNSYLDDSVTLEGYIVETIPEKTLTAVPTYSVKSGGDYVNVDSDGKVTGKAKSGTAVITVTLKSTDLKTTYGSTTITIHNVNSYNVTINTYKQNDDGTTYTKTTETVSALYGSTYDAVEKGKYPDNVTGFKKNTSKSNTSITVSNDTSKNVINLYYDRDVFTATIICLDANNGNAEICRTTQTGTAGSTVTISAPTKSTLSGLTDYVVDDNSSHASSKSVTFNGNQTVYFYYDKMVTVTVQTYLQNADGSYPTSASSSTSGKQRAGSTYTATYSTIEHYNSSSYSGTVNGITVNNDASKNIVKLYYDRKLYPVTINYIDKNSTTGAAVQNATTTSQTYRYGTTANITDPTVSGWVRDENCTATQSVTVNSATPSVTFYYDKYVTVKVYTYKETAACSGTYETGTPVQHTNQRAGSTYTANYAAVSGYTKNVGHASTANGITLNNDNSKNIVKLYYTKNYLDAKLNSSALGVNNSTADSITINGVGSSDTLTLYPVMTRGTAVENVASGGTWSITGGNSDSYAVSTAANGVGTLTFAGKNTGDLTVKLNFTDTDGAKYETSVTVTATAGIDLERDVLVDYGMTMNIPVSGKVVGLSTTAPNGVTAETQKVSSNPFSTTTVNVNGRGTASIKSGAADSGSTIVYTSTEGILQNENSKIEIFYSVQLSGGGYKYSQVTIYPASTVYYEDSVGAVIKNKDDGTANSANGITYTNGKASEGAFGTWTVDGTEKVDVADLADEIYGNSSSHNNEQLYSMGSAHKVTVSAKNNPNKKYSGSEGNYWPTASFTFYGTGFDVISRTGNDCGMVKVNVDGTDYIVDTYRGYSLGNVTGKEYIRYLWFYAEDGTWHVKYSTTNDAPNNGTYLSAAQYQAEITKGTYSTEKPGSPKKDDEFATYVENKGWSKGTAGVYTYQVPIIKVLNLSEGTHTVTITPTYSTAFNQTSGSSYSFYLDAVRIYGSAGENSGEGTVKFFNLKELLKANIGTFKTAGTVIIDGSAEASVSEYNDFGANNEIYLNGGNALTFGLSASPNPTKVLLGLKTYNSASASVEVTYQSSKSDKPVTKTLTTNSRTDMYYQLDDAVAGTISISNVVNGSTVVLTTLKVTFASSGSASIHTNEVKAETLSASSAAKMAEGDITADETDDIICDLVIDEAILAEGAEYHKAALLAAVPTAAKVFEPTVSVDAPEKATVGDDVTVTVTTSDDVAYITVNGNKVETNDNFVWTYTVKAEEVGEMSFEVKAYSANDVEAQAAHLVSVTVEKMPFVPRLEVFAPEKVTVGEDITLEVSTSDDVAYITVNGNKVEISDSFVWTYTVKAEEVGEMSFEVKAYNAEDEVAENTVTVAVTVEKMPFEPFINVMVPAAVKVGETVTVQVVTSSDVAYITVNGEKVETHDESFVWTYTVTADSEGELSFVVVAYSEDGTAAENAKTAVVSVSAQAKSTWDIIIDALLSFFKKLLGGN